MQFIERKDIDSKMWDNRIATDSQENIFCLSWYLDAVADNWGALVTENYETILPVPYTKKLGIKNIYQPPFSRELDIFGTQFTWQEALEKLTPDFKNIQFRNESEAVGLKKESRSHQIIEHLNDDLKYSTNANRLIKKADKLYHYQIATNPHQLIELFKKTALKKIDSISTQDLMKLEKLMLVAVENGGGELIEAYQENNFAGAGFFLKDKQRIIFLKSAANESDKKNGVMFGLVNFAIKRYTPNFNRFDFGGSDVESVANFYKKFGASDRTYYNYNIDNLPLWYKALKRIKR